ncbi:MAG: alpha/beta hydrolase [Alphaproteobacteria bacterium]|nr:alpha/beta hydrolase [Alphaproteobacteria bacterium]
MRRGYADTAQGQMHYWTLGEGKPLVLLHASPRSARVYQRLIPLLAARHRVIAFDTLGFGNSDPLPAGATMESLARCVTEAMDSLGIAKANLFGFHTGNKIGAALAAGFASRVEKFVLVGMTHSIVIERAKRDAAILGIVQKGLDADGADRDPARVLRRWATLFGSVSETWWSGDVIGRTDFGSDDLVQLENEALDKIQARVAFDSIYRANFGFDLTAAIRRITAPTLIVELATPQEDHLGRQGEAVCKLLKRGELVVFENTDRDVLERDPKQLARAVLDFLAKP